MRASGRSIALLALLLAPVLACGESSGSVVFATGPNGPTATTGGTTGARLTGLTLTAGTISPGFNASTTSYQTTVPNTTTSTRVVATAAAGSTITVNGVTVASGAESPDIPLSVGTNNISVLVTSGSSSQTYSINVRRSS